MQSFVTSATFATFAFPAVDRHRVRVLCASVAQATDEAGTGSITISVRTEFAM